MKTYFLYTFKDCDVFAPVDFLQNWKLVVDKTPERHALAIILPNGTLSMEPTDIEHYHNKARLPLLFPVYHMIIDNFQDLTFQEYRQKNTLS